MNTKDIINYLKNAKENFVVMQKNGEPVSWSDGSGAVVYGSRGDCDIDESMGEYIITEYEYIIQKVNKLK